jgi:hypothetical protein
VLEGKGALKQITDALNAPDIRIVHSGSGAVRDHIDTHLGHRGWASPVTVAEGFKVELGFIKDRIVIQVQTGNVARAFYDLMKMQALFHDGKVDCGVLIVPMAAAARTIGGNLAQFERVNSELEGIFFHQVTIPVLILGFE